MENCWSAALPPASAARATCGMPPASVAARRISAGGNVGRRGERLQHHALERPLTQLADDQAQQEVLLLRGGFAEQIAELRLACGGRALALDRLQVLERGVDVRHREAR